MKRIVRVRSTESNVLTTHTVENVTTYGELQSALNVDWSNNNVVLREGKLTLEMAGAVLPAGDITVFVMPKKTKAGAMSPNDIEELGFHELRGVCRENNLPANGRTAEQMRADLKALFVDSNESSVTKQEILERLNSLQEKVNQSFAEVEQFIKSFNFENDLPYRAEIEEEFEAIRAELGV
jgi:hypothetical protein